MVLQYNMSPLLVHDTMFTDLVENQITDDQKKMWMDDIRSYNIVGTYAQTELGHGKNRWNVGLFTDVSIQLRQYFELI